MIAPAHALRELPSNGVEDLPCSRYDPGVVLRRTIRESAYSGRPEPSRTPSSRIDRGLRSVDAVRHSRKTGLIPACGHKRPTARGFTLIPTASGHTPVHVDSEHLTGDSLAPCSSISPSTTCLSHRPHRRLKSGGRKVSGLSGVTPLSDSPTKSHQPKVGDQLRSSVCVDLRKNCRRPFKGDIAPKPQSTSASSSGDTPSCDRECVSPSDKRCLSPGEIHDKLKKHFRRALSHATNTPTKLFLELFAGRGKVSRALQRSGFASLAFDIENGPEFDLTHPRVLSIIKGWISSGCILGVCLETQCSSWSRARRGPAHSNWCALRSNKHIYGVPGLSDKNQEKVNKGNIQARNTSHIIRTCIKHFVPCILENPNASLLWTAPCIKVLSNLSLAHAQTFDMCQYGTRWRKATRLMSWHCGHDSDICLRCQGRKGVCSRTHKKHIVLAGSSNIPGKLWTTLAQVYPSALAKKLAAKLIKASYPGQSRNLLNGLRPD